MLFLLLQSSNLSSRQLLPLVVLFGNKGKRSNGAISYLPLQSASLLSLPGVIFRFMKTGTRRL